MGTPVKHGSPTPQKSKARCYVGLRGVIVAHFELEAKVIKMAAAHQVRLGEMLYCVLRS